MAWKRPFSVAIPPKRAFRFGMFEFQDPILLCCLLYLLLMRDGTYFLRLSLLASVCHECGHVLVYFLLCKKMPCIHVSATGFCMKTKQNGFSSRQTFVLALAGPAVNFLLAFFMLLWLRVQFRLMHAAFLSANVWLGLFNLLPVAPLDGAVLLGALHAIWRSKLQSKGK